MRNFLKTTNIRAVLLSEMMQRVGGTASTPVSPSFRPGATGSVMQTPRADIAKFVCIDRKTHCRKITDHRAWRRTARYTFRQERAMGNYNHGIGCHRTDYRQPCLHLQTEMTPCGRRKDRNKKEGNKRKRENEMGQKTQRRQEGECRIYDK